jgi:ABC-type polysaccharide/polyol phosphate transport system ATPase subunit
MSKISVRNLTIKFRIYHDRSPSLKESFANLFKKKSRTSYSDFKALNNVSLEIEAGDRIGIIGHNGAGKSTLLKALCRVYESDEGSVRVKGRLAPLLEIGAGFHPEFTGRENIYLNGSILGISKKVLSEIEAEVIAFAGIEEFIDTPVKYYSTGMYMRLAFSLATAVDPDILLLDEVFAGGDADFMVKARERMFAMVDKANILIMVSHDLSIINTLCKRVIWIDHGRLLADGPTDLVVARYLRNDR